MGTEQLKQVITALVNDDRELAVQNFKNYIDTTAPQYLDSGKSLEMEFSKPNENT